MKEIILKVTGMMCEGCENRIQNAVKNMEGVEIVVANHQEGTVKLSLNENADISKIKEKIEDIGFTVEN